MASNYFVLDVGETFIKIADCKRQGNQIQAQALTTFPLNPVFFPTDTEAIIEKQGEDLAKSLSTLHLTTNNVNLILPDSLTFNQILFMPFLKEKEMLSAIRYQADQFIPLPLDQINLDVEILHEDRTSNKKLTLISAAPKRIVEKVEKMAEYAGLVPVSLETELAAVGRYLAEIFKPATAAQPQKGGMLFVNLNVSATSLYFYDPSVGLVTMAHNFSRGLNIFIREVMTNLNIEEKQALAALAAFGTQSTSTQSLPTILEAALKDFLGQIQRFIGLIVEKQKAQVGSIFLINESVRFGMLDKVTGKYLGIPTSYFDAYPSFVASPIVDSYKNQLGYFLSTVGGNLR